MKKLEWDDYKYDGPVWVPLLLLAVLIPLAVYVHSYNKEQERIEQAKQAAEKSVKEHRRKELWRDLADFWRDFKDAVNEAAYPEKVEREKKAKESI